MLNDKALAIHEYIVRITEEVGYPPTIREIGEEFGIRSTNGVRYYLNLLDKAGYITLNKDRKSRSILSLRSPASHRRSAMARGVGAVADAGFGLGIPIIGRVAAGVPIEAEENIDGHLTLEEMFPARDDLLALRVDGQSMRDRGIHDGDVVVVRKQEHARDGDAVVALVGGDATVKTYRRVGDVVELVPENPDFTTLRLGPNDDLRLLGVVVGLVRPMGGARRI